MSSETTPTSMFILFVCAYYVECSDIMSKMEGLKAAIESMCGNSTPTSTSPPIQQYYHPVNWTSVTKKYIGSSNLQHASTMTFTIPNIIPSSAREVLIFVGANIGGSNRGPYQDVIIFTQIGTTRYEKYLTLYSWTQNAINTNSENMWFPMPPNRRVYLTVPARHDRNARVRFFAIGYR